MKIGLQAATRERAFTLVDGIIAMAIAGLMFAALYTGLAFGFNTIKFARENTRATQIMLQRMELIRLYRWDQIGTINTNRMVDYYSQIAGTNSGLTYTSQVTIAAANLGTSYDADMRKVTVTLQWVTGQTPRTRSMSTYVTRNGMQSYVY